MHDHNSEFLRRTTDIENKFPGRVYNQSADFTWQELQSLNAGEWFIDVSLVTFKTNNADDGFYIVVENCIGHLFSDFPDRSFLLSVESLRR